MRLTRLALKTDSFSATLDKLKASSGSGSILKLLGSTDMLLLSYSSRRLRACKVLSLAGLNGLASTLTSSRALPRNFER